MKRKFVAKKVVSRVANEELVAKRHEQIVRAAGELFSKKGFHATTMREISSSSGINLSYIYKYVASKDDILYLFYEYLHKQWHPIYQSLSESENENPVDQLKNFLRLFLEIIHKFIDEILTMYTECRHLERDSLYAVLSQESEMVEAIEKLIVRGVNKGSFKVKDSFMAANFIQYIIVIEALRGWNFRDRYTFNRFVDLFIDLVLNALGMREEDNE
jgi:AcrR family transcriptional regulator